MIEKVNLVFTKLCREIQKPKPNGCHLLLQEVKYSGHYISTQGIKADPDNMSVIQNWPLPTSEKHL